MKSSPDLKEYILFMHSDRKGSEEPEKWTEYFSRLRDSGRFKGGSAIGDGECLRKDATPGQLHSSLGGYIRVLALDLDDARTFVTGNPVFEAGGTVEIRELPKTS